MRSRNSDWRYIRYTIPKLAQFTSNIEFAAQQSVWQSIGGNLKTIGAAVGRRIGLPTSSRGMAVGRLSASDLKRSGANVIFTHTYPINAGGVPVVWWNAIVDPEMQLNIGTSAERIEEEIAVKREYFKRSTIVQVCTEAEAQRHREMFPESADRFYAAPLFTPQVRACPQSNLEKHLRPEIVRLLFVGNSALWKGLPELLSAFCALPNSVKSRARLTVISKFDRSRIKLPSDPNLVVLRGAPNQQVMEEMRRAHIFVDVARFESYGAVFHEAMSQGAACVGPHWEVQRELLDNGKAGLNLKNDPETIRLALEELIEDDDRRLQFGSAAWERFQARYTSEIIAERYMSIFAAALRAS